MHHYLVNSVFIYAPFYFDVLENSATPAAYAAEY